EGSRNARGLSNSACTTLKIAVFAPMPSASVATAIVVNPGERDSVRSENRRSCSMRLRYQPASGSSNRGRDLTCKRHAKAGRDEQIIRFAAGHRVAEIPVRKSDLPREPSAKLRSLGEIEVDTVFAGSGNVGEKDELLLERDHVSQEFPRQLIPELRLTGS